MSMVEGSQTRAKGSETGGEPGLTFRDFDGRVRVCPDIHPFADLLDLTADQVVERIAEFQAADFALAVRQLEDPRSQLRRRFDALAARSEAFAALPMLGPGGAARLFEGLHDHVMSHPVWRHPFFVRFFAGRFSHDQAARFAVQYFNQVKNTRQCVALAMARFHSLAPLPFGPLNEAVSEMVQVVLAQLVADEYGVGTHAVADYPNLAQLVSSTTHMTLYRQLFDGLGVAEADQDAPMIDAIADLVLTQRLLAGDEAFTPLEALASVGLGMEWGVPAFFSLLLGGLIRAGSNEAALALSPRHLEVFSAHVRYDVLHAVAVMTVTGLFMTGQEAEATVRQAVNALMAARYAAMSALYAEVFGEPCARLEDAALETRHRIDDRRVADRLVAARRRVSRAAVAAPDAYARREDHPFPLTAAAAGTPRLVLA